MYFPNEPQRLSWFNDDIAEEPAVINRVVDAYEQHDNPLAGLDLPPSDAPVIFAGMGSSYNASIAAAWWLRVLGVPSWATWASEIDKRVVPQGASLVVTSQSGNTKECLRAAENFRAAGGRTVIGVTNSDDCAVVDVADFTLPLLAGPEGGISAKSYVASVAVLTILAGAITGAKELAPSALRSAAEVSQQVIGGFREQADALCELVNDQRVVHVIGSGAGLAAAEEGGLIFKEAPKYPFEGMLTSDWLHGSFYTIKPGQFTGILLEGSPAGWRDPEARSKIQDLGGSLITIGAEPGGDVHVPLGGLNAATRPLVEITVLELLASELWHRRLVVEGAVDSPVPVRES